MTPYDNRPLTLRQEPKAGSRRVSFGPVSQRLASVFRPADDPEARPEGRRLARWLPDDREEVGDEVPSRFPLARNGYDRVAVDRHVAELEHELSEMDRELVDLRSQSLSTDEVATEIRRIGEQTSEVLITAHEQRGEILRVAREEADRCVAEAQAQARAITLAGEARWRELEAQNGAAQGERDRLLADLRSVSAALATVVDTAEDRIPVEDAEAPTALKGPTVLNSPTDPDPPTEPGPLLAG
jgi:hypothetical protein